MGWIGYGIYDGDGTQTRHYDFLKWAKIGKNDDDIEPYLTVKGTILPEEFKQKLKSNISLVLKKMPKVPLNKWHKYDEYSAIEWQMLLALFVNNEIIPNEEIFNNGREACEYLMGEHASEFNNPSSRKRNLKKFVEKARKLYVSG